ncbi:HNH endonuclease signature motif containing protein, partial [Nocardioides zeicaulis]
MIDTQVGLGAGEVTDDLDAAGLLATLRASRLRENAEAARQLDLAARWADLHPPESIHDAAAFTVPGVDHEEPIAGDGCPLVTEFCIPELGAVLGISTTAAKKLIGHALELRHRLPRLWGQVHAGQVPAWRARLVAETTIHAFPALTPEAAGWIDTQVAAVAGKVGTAQLDRLVAEAIKRYDLSVDPRPEFEAGEDHEDFEADQYLNHDARHVTFDTRHVHYDGLMRMEAELDLADAYDLDAAIAHGAATLKALGSTAPLGARRASALGDLARTQTALDLHTQGTSMPAAPTGDHLPAAREVVLHVHLDADFADNRTVFGPTARLEKGQRLALVEQVKAWCASSRTKVTIRPVLDLNTELATDTYAIPDRIREHVVLRDRTCVFPWCTRPARACDIDHVIPYDHDAAADGRPQPGPTATSNLSPLCRSHHRLKTHTAWRYVHLRAGVFEWTSPHGHHYLRDHDGTTALDPPAPPKTT